MATRATRPPSSTRNATTAGVRCVARRRRSASTTATTATRSCSCATNVSSGRTEPAPRPASEALAQERGDRAERPRVDVALGLARSAQGARADLERVVAALHAVQRRRRLHPAPDVLERVERAERVPRPLHEEDGRAQRDEDLGPELAAPGAQRVPEADERVDRLLEREVAADARARRL